jgi:hypothetical protein
MLSLAVLALFARLAAAAPASGGAVINVGLASGSTPLDVVATVSNAGASDVAVLKYSPLLASTPIKHFRVFDATGIFVPSLSLCSALIEFQVPSYLLVV